MASLNLNYAEDVREKSKAGLSQIEHEPEEPHQTTDVLSATRVYHNPRHKMTQKKAAGKLSVSRRVTLSLRIGCAYFLRTSKAFSSLK